MPLNIIRVSEIELSDTITCLVYGLPRSGKTQFAASAGDDNLIINLAGGISTLRGATYKRMVGQNPMVLDIFEEYDEKGLPLGKAVDRVGEAIDEAIKNRGTLNFNTITIDEGTTLAAHALVKAVKYNFEIGKTKTWEQVVKKHDFLMAHVADMGAQRSVLEQFCDYYCNLAKREHFNFIMVAHEKDTYEPAKIGEPVKVDKVAPYFVGESAKVIPGYFDWVLRMESISGGTKLSCRAWTIGSEKMIAGVRTGGIFDPKLDNPNFTQMAQQYREYIAKQQPTIQES